ncbi:MAG: hypothetical protein K5900_12445 [Butyrivibrio sp.]|nr:hypothetical protein [Butyrivibrio sp.]
MSTMVKWGSLKFRVDGKVVRSIKDFSASLVMKGDDSKSKKKFTELEEVSFTVMSSLATKGNPIKDYDYLKSFINFKEKGYKLMVNNGTGTSLSAWKGGYFNLTEVSLASTQMDGRGRIIAAEIQLKFTEVNNKKTQKIGTKKKIKKYRKKSNLKNW